MIEPIIDVHKKDFAHSQFHDGAVHDPLSQRQKVNIVLLYRNQLDHHIASTSSHENLPANADVQRRGGGQDLVPRQAVMPPRPL